VGRSQKLLLQLLRQLLLQRQRQQHLHQLQKPRLVPLLLLSALLLVQLKMQWLRVRVLLTLLKLLLELLRVLQLALQLTQLKLPQMPLKRQLSQRSNTLHRCKKSANGRFFYGFVAWL
jgi:hypothetical protein